MTDPRHFLNDPMGWLVVTGAGVIGWMGRMMWRDSREVRQTLLEMQKEQSDAMHATAEALNRNTDALKTNTEVIRRVAAQNQLPPSSSGQQ